MAIPITDSHMHLGPDGRGADAVKEFLAAGGTHIFLATKPLDAPVRDVAGFRAEFETTLRMAEAARGAGAVVNCILGPHPVHYPRLLGSMPREEADALMKEGIDLAARLCEEGLAVAIGEVGMPHFPVEPWIREDAVRQLEFAMERAREADAAVIVHCESSDTILGELAALAREAGLHGSRLVKHYAPPATAAAREHGIFLSILAKEDNVLTALEGGTDFMLETDYIDDPKRPGAVLGPRTVPRVTLRMLADGKLTEEQAHLLHVENPGKVFGVDVQR